MLFLVELDHVKSGMMVLPEAGRAFIEQIIFPTLSRAEQLVTEKEEACTRRACADDGLTANRCGLSGTGS